MIAQQSGLGLKVWERETYKPKSSDKGTHDQEPHKNISMLKLNGPLLIQITIHKHA
jgi:hypothetical protein